MIAAPRARPTVSWAGPAALAATVALGAIACHRDIRLLPVGDSSGGAGGGVGGAAGAGAGGAAGAVDAGAGAAGAAGMTAACLPPGDPIVLPTVTGGATCAAALETRGHRFALCACDTLTLGARLRTDAFDSTNSGNNDQVSAAVGTDGALVTTAELEAGGAIYVADPGGVSADGHLQAGASFRSGGPLTMLASNAEADLLGDAYVNGDLTGMVKVSGTLFVPTTVTVGSNVEAPTVSPGPVLVSAPCDCSDGFVDVADAITTAELDNGDAAAGFDPNALAMVSIATQLSLGCGTYFLNAIGATAPITLVVHGRTLLAVANSVSLGSGLTVALDSSAELDLLVGGWINTSGGTIGAPSAPARFRIWTASTDSLTFDDQPTIAAVVHAPGSVATATSGLTLSGSLFVKTLILGGDSELHYDRAILSAGAECGEQVATPIP
jgi:hypothetical protein